MPAVSPQAALALATLLTACADPKPPTERVAVVRTDAAPALPGFSKPKPTSPATPVLHRGDVILTDREEPPLDWSGMLDTAAATRHGALLQSYRARADSRIFVFRSDLDLDVDVPASAWICQGLGALVDQASCPTALRRIHIDHERTAAYIATTAAASPLAVVVRGRLTSRTADGLTDLRLATLAGRPTLLMSTRWVRSPEWTGGSIAALRPEPGLPTIAEMATDEVDARDPSQVTSRVGAVEVGPDAVRFVGVRRKVSRDGVELDRADLDETHRFTSEGALAR